MQMMSSGWSWFVIIGVLGNILAITWLLLATSKIETDEDGGDESKGHQWDGIRELNHPLPKWWFNLFIITVVFSIVYLVLYPGLGNFSGTLGWTQNQEFEDKVAASRAATADVFEPYRAVSEIELAKNTKAMGTGARLFANYYSTCHGFVGRGGPGFPNLTANDWLCGGQREHNKHNLLEGR